MSMTEDQRAIMELENTVEQLLNRLMIVERFVALSLKSSGAEWKPDTGLDFSRSPNSEVTTMIMGTQPWDPAKLDKGG